MLRQIVHYGV